MIAIKHKNNFSPSGGNPEGKGGSFSDRERGPEPIITVQNLVKKFGNFVANDHLTFDVFKGEIFGFLGANGAGKTTAIRILCGLSSPTSGEVKVAGFDIYRETEKIKKIGFSLVCFCSECRNPRL